MKTRWVAVVWIALLGAGGFSALTPQEAPRSARAGGSGEESFIRMDLLRRDKKTTPAAQRNIFAPGKARFSESPDEFFGVREVLEEGNSRQDAGQSFSAVDLRYIGYVRSGKKMVALVIFQGEAFAVAEGEEIEAGVTVIKILPEEIEVTGLDSKSSRFPLEGELP